MQNREIQEYLNQSERKLQCLKYYNDLIGTPMKEDCVLSLVLPAHNESENIIKCIQAAERQNPLKGPNGLLYPYEVLIVVNNSDDDTYSKAKEYLEKSTSKVPVYVVNINFDEGERGVGSARRFGTDLELYRMYLREAGAIKECYFVGGDADEQIPQNHLECIVNTFRESQADLLLGEFGYNYEAFPKVSEMYALFKAVQEYRCQNRLYKELFGGNHALTAELYMKVGGYANKLVGEDTYLLQCATKCGAKTAPLPSEVIDNPRRMLINPLEYLTHEAWDEKVFLERQKDIRGCMVNSYQYKDEEIRGALTLFVDEWAIRYSLNHKQNIQEVVERKRNELIDAMERNAVRKELFIRNDLFYEHHIINYKIMRKFMPIEKRYQLLVKERTGLELFCKETGAVPMGDFAEWIQNAYDSGKKIPLIPEVKVYVDQLEYFLEHLHLQGYELFQKKKIGNHSFLKKMSLQEVSLEIMDSILWLVKVNQQGTIVYQEESLGRIGLAVVKHEIT